MKYLKICFIIFFVCFFSNTSYANFSMDDEVVVGCTHFPPFMIKKETSVEGIVEDYLSLLKERYGLKYRYQCYQRWPDLIRALKSKEVDIIPSMVNTEKRRKLFDFTAPYISYPMVLVSTDKESFIDGFEGLGNRNLGVVKGSIADTLASEVVAKSRVNQKGSILEGLTAVSVNEVDVALAALPSVVYLIQEHSLSNLKIVGQIDYRSHISVGVLKDNLDLKNAFEKMLSVLDSESQKTIRNKWFKVKVEQEFTGLFILKILFGFFILIVVFIFWNRLLSKKIKNEVRKRLLAEKEKKEHENYLQQQKKLADMGQMINAIAHQWRQPLNNVGLIYQNLVHEIEVKDYHIDKLDQYSSIFEETIRHMSKTIDDFRSFFKPEKEKVAFNVMSSIFDILNLVFAQLENNRIEVVVSCSCSKNSFTSSDFSKKHPCKNEDVSIFGFPNEFKQVLLNIIYNAKDIFSERDIADRSIEICVKVLEENVMVAICDNAKGIPNDVIEKVFDPYFTTRGDHKGTGLGLYLAKIIIEDHFGGSISVENNDRGACFKIEIPKVIY